MLQPKVTIFMNFLRCLSVCVFVISREKQGKACTEEERVECFSVLVYVGDCVRMCETCFFCLMLGDTQAIFTSLRCLTTHTSSTSSLPYRLPCCSSSEQCWIPPPTHTPLLVRWGDLLDGGSRELFFVWYATPTHSNVPCWDICSNATVFLSLFSRLTLTIRPVEHTSTTVPERKRRHQTDPPNSHRHSSSPPPPNIARPAPLRAWTGYAPVLFKPALP